MMAAENEKLDRKALSPGDVVCDEDGCMLMLDTEDDGIVDSAVPVEDTLPGQGAAQRLILEPAFEFFSVTCTLLLLVTFSLGYGVELAPGTRQLVDASDIGCSIFFLFEFLVRWWAVGLRRRHLFKPLTALDLLNVLPILISPGLPYVPSTPLSPYAAASVSGTAVAPLAPLRLLRAARILRLRRLLQPEDLTRLVRFITADPDAEVNEVTRLSLRLAFSALSIVIVSAGLVWQVERTTNPALDGFLDAVYLSFNIITTVGLGDIVPKTDPGRLVVVLEQAAAVTIIPLELAALSRALIAQASVGESQPPSAASPTSSRGLRRTCAFHAVEHEADARFCRLCGEKLVLAKDETQTATALSPPTRGSR